MNAAMPLKKVPVLKLILVIRNKSVQELANFVGNERSQVSTWVNGRDEPSREQAKKIAQYLKWDLDEIWEDEATVVKKKRGSKEKIGPAKLVDEDALKLTPESIQPITHAPAERHLRALNAIEVDPQLDTLASIDKQPGAVPVDLYESIAAGGLDDKATEKAGVIYVPKSFASCYGLRVTGTSMVNAGIDPGDVLIVKLATRAKEGRITVALMEDGATVKRYRLLHGEPTLCAEGDGHPNIPASDGFRVQGIPLAIYKPQRK